MKYLLFDLAVLASLVVAALKLLGRAGVASSSASAPASECNGSYPDNNNDNDVDDSSTNRQHPKLPDVFEVDDIVHMFDPAVHREEEGSLRARVVRAAPGDGGGIRYDVVAEETGETLRDVDPSSVRPREAAYNAPALCNVRGEDLLRAANPVPCAVLADIGRDEDFYHVWGTYFDGSLRYYVLPWWRIRAIEYSSEGGFASVMRHRGLSGDNNSNQDPLRGVVELLDEGPTFPAIITNYREEDDTYFLSTSVPKSAQGGVKRKFIRPYQVYKDETKAHCKVNAFKPGQKFEMVKCTIISHSVKSVGFVSYQVSYRGKGNELVRESLPFSKVWRLLY